MGEKEEVREQLRRRLDFVSFARMHFISALHGSGVGDIFGSIDEAYGFAMKKWPTNNLTRLLEDVVADHQPPMVRGHRIKLRYAHQGGSNPPVIVIHGNQTSALPGSYKRYLENKFTKVLAIKGTPLRFEFRSSDNPFKDKKNELSKRQQMKKVRFKQHLQKQKKKAKKK